MTCRRSESEQLPAARLDPVGLQPRIGGADLEGLLFQAKPKQRGRRRRSRRMRFSMRIENWEPTLCAGIREQLQRRLDERARHWLKTYTVPPVGASQGTDSR